MKKWILAAAILSATATTSLANDTTAVLKTGGLQFTSTADISMEKEVLSISPEKVMVDYVYKNTASRDIESIIAFPMPDIEGSPEWNVAIGDTNSDNFLGFAVTQDGAEIKPDLQQRAYVGPLDVTDELQKAGIPLLPLSEKTSGAIAKLSRETIDKWVHDGLIIDDSYDDGSGMKSHFTPVWTLKSAYYWRTVFPAGAEVHVSHSYTPSVGGTVAVTFLDEKGNPNEPFFSDYKSKYCIDSGIISAAKKTAASVATGQPAYTEEWISYILTTGNNWAGPIKDFTLILDKGEKANLISFCGDGVKKIGPTTFQMKKQDFYPDRDLDILILKASN